MNTLQTHLQNIIERNYKISADTHVLLVYDRQCKLASLLADGYQEVIKKYSHHCVDFEKHPEQEILKIFAELPPHSLIVLVQSTSFRMTKHRLRADLFRQGHMVIEHTRLSLNTEEETTNYIASLQYDTPYYVQACTFIERLLGQHRNIRVESGKDLVLNINSVYERPIKNTGDFTDNPIASTGFPIGEIFTEAKELEALGGSVLVFAFPTLEHKTYFAEPFVVTIKDGCVVHHTGPAEFEQILQIIKAEEEGGKVQVREIGFGLNRGIGFASRLHEPTAFERFAGMHFSLGLKHAMYRHKIDKKIWQKYHIDIFCLVDQVFIGDTQIFEKGKYLV